MRLKDIEGQLKNEHNSQAVPDVLQRAKKAPINKLLDGQTPLKAFDKHTAVRLLWCVMLLLVTAVLATFAIAMIPDGAKDEVAVCYVNLKVESNGETVVYGIVVENYETVSVFVKERQNQTVIAQNLQKRGYSLESAINDVYEQKEGDRITICVLGKDVSADFANVVKDMFSPYAANTSVNDSTVILELKDFLGSDETDVGALVDEYVTKFQQ